MNFEQQQRQSEEPEETICTPEKASPSPEKGQKSSAKKRKAQKLKRVLKERLDIDCLRMLCPEACNEDSVEVLNPVAAMSAINDQGPS